MKIETTYDIEQDVFLMHENKIIFAKVSKIYIEKSKGIQCESYGIYRANGGDTNKEPYGVKLLFPTREALKESL